MLEIGTKKAGALNRSDSVTNCKRETFDGLFVMCGIACRLIIACLASYSQVKVLII